MKTIHKFRFKIDDSFTIESKKIEKFLLVEMQSRFPCLWVLVDLDSEPQAYHFRMFGTGQNIISENVEHIGSFQQGGFVWHLFFNNEDQKGHEG